MFHYRWRYQPDVWSTAERIARQMMDAQGTLAVAQARAAVAERMTRGSASSAPTRRPSPPIEGSVQARAGPHRGASAGAAVHAGRPAAMADFGLWGQFYELATDPTPGAIMRAARRR
jgi:hypothetical protein